MGLPKLRENQSTDRGLAEIIEEIVAFRDRREWGRFHSPRNLAAALAVEVSELQELLLWKTDGETADLLNSIEGRKDATYEIADVLIYALLFCKTLGIEPIEAIRCKLAENERKYPVRTAKGNALKYSELQKLTRTDMGAD